MPRWDPQAQERLRTAAIDLFLEHGYDTVTVAQIADRAGLTRRTFSRYFTDKRDVLFAGSDELPGLLADAVTRADPRLAPFDALLVGLAEVGARLGERVAPHAAARREVIARSPELQERGLSKFAAVATALAQALRERAVDEVTAMLLADVAVAIFQSAFGRWVDDPKSGDLPSRVREAAGELRDATTRKAEPRR